MYGFYNQSEETIKRRIGVEEDVQRVMHGLTITFFQSKGFSLKRPRFCIQETTVNFIKKKKTILRNKHKICIFITYEILSITNILCI